MSDDLSAAAEAWAAEHSIERYRIYLDNAFKAGARWAYADSIRVIDEKFGGGYPGEDYYSRPIRARAAGEGAK